MPAPPAPWGLFLLPVASTLVGGLFAIRLRSRMHVLLALGAGVLLGAAFLDLLPEAFSLGAAARLSRGSVLGIALLSFLFFLLLDSAVQRWTANGQQGGRSVTAGRVAGAMLIFHSFRDGMAIGASYAAMPEAGYGVALGIGAHDFGDGLNTMLLTTRGRAPGRADYLFLAADALAPLCGGLLATSYFGSLRSSAVLVAIAVGFFVQMAANDLLPELRHYATARGLVAACLVGGAMMVYLTNVLLRAHR